MLKLTAVVKTWKSGFYFHRITRFTFKFILIVCTSSCTPILRFNFNISRLKLIYILKESELFFMHDTSYLILLITIQYINIARVVIIGHVGRKWFVVHVTLKKIVSIYPPFIWLLAYNLLIRYIILIKYD